MFELHESSDKDELAEKIDKIISDIEENQVGNHEENVITDDDVTIVLSQTDDDKSISEEDASNKKRSPSVISDQSHKSSNMSQSSNKSKSKSKSRRGFNLKKKLSKESENVSQVKSVVDEKQNGSPGKTKTPYEEEVEKVKLPNDSGVKVVRRGRKVITPKINSITSPPKQPTSGSLSLPDVCKSVASSFSSSAMEKPGEETTVKKRGRRAAATPHSSQKNNEELVGEKEEEEELEGPAKFKKYKNMTDRMRSVCVLVQRLSPLIVSQARVANQKSSSEVKEASEKSAVPDDPLAEEEIPEEELILSMDEVDDDEPEVLSSRKREMESVDEGSEEKRPRVEENATATLIVIAIPVTSVTALIEENSPTDAVNPQITAEEKLVTTPRPGRGRRGRPRKSITPVLTKQIASKEDDVTVVADPESKKTIPAKSKPKLHSESSDAEDFVEEAAGVNEGTKQDTQSVDQKESPIEVTPSKLTSKRGRGRPLKASPRIVLTNILTRRNSNTSSVIPSKKIRLSDEISITSAVESRRDVENSEKGNVTNSVQKKDVKSGARRGRPAKASISPKPTIEKSPDTGM
jgi:hypothetical protein